MDGGGGGRVESGAETENNSGDKVEDAKPDDCRDAEGRATQDAKAEDYRFALPSPVFLNPYLDIRPAII